MTPTKLTARPTTYKGIPMRSRLEAKYAQWLDDIGASWEYEPQCFANEGGQYLPDFLVHDVTILGSPRELYVEVKPTFLTTSELDDLLARMSIVFASQPDTFMALEIAQADITKIVFPPDYNMSTGLPGTWGRTEAGETALFCTFRRLWAA